MEGGGRGSSELGGGFPGVLHMEILPTHTQINPNHNPKSTAQPLCIGFEHAPLGAVLGSLGNPWGTLRPRDSLRVLGSSRQ